MERLPFDLQLIILCLLFNCLAIMTSFFAQKNDKRETTMNRDKQTSCNLPVARYKSITEITSIGIHGSCVYRDNIYIALLEILRLIRADKPNQMSRLAYQKLILTAQNDQ